MLAASQLALACAPLARAAFTAAHGRFGPETTRRALTDVPLPRLVESLPDAFDPPLKVRRQLNLSDVIDV
jgi:hypothetical protein